MFRVIVLASLAASLVACASPPARWVSIGPRLPPSLNPPADRYLPLERRERRPVSDDEFRAPTPAAENAGPEGVRSRQ